MWCLADGVLSVYCHSECKDTQMSKIRSACFAALYLQRSNKISLCMNLSVHSGIYLCVLLLIYPCFLLHDMLTERSVS